MADDLEEYNTIFKGKIDDRMEWNLTDLFKSEEDFYQEIEQVRLEWQRLCSFREWNSTLLEETLRKECSLHFRTNKILVYGNLRYYQNIQSDVSIKLKQVATDFSEEMIGYQKMLEAFFIILGKDKIKYFIYQNQNLREYQFYLENLFRLREHITDSSLGKIRNHNEKINQSIDKYHKLLLETTSGFIEFDGKKEELSLKNWEKFLTSSDREIRKNSYLLINQAFKNDQREYAWILNQIYQARVKNARLENYHSVLEKAFVKDNLDPSILTFLIESVHQNLEISQSYLALKGKNTNISLPHLYDLTIPLGRRNLKHYTLKEAIAIIREALHPLGEDYLKIVDLLLESGHIDTKLRDEKHPSITFSWNTYSFLNFRGEYKDLKNLIHELGHIVHYYLAKENVCSFYEDSSIFIGEIASLVNEILLNRYLYEKADNMQEKIFYLSLECENFYTTVFKQTMYTEFENILYNYVTNGYHLTCTFLNRTYQRLLQAYYGDDVTYDKVSFSGWIRLGHLYRHAYYPYQYATGLLMAYIVVHTLLDDKTLSMQEYLHFLSLGSSNYPIELLKIIHIDWENKKILNSVFLEYRHKIAILENFINEKD